MGRTPTKGKQVDNLGNVQGTDVLGGYKVSKRDENTGSVSYYGEVQTDGSWIILRETPTGAVTVSEYASGTSNFDTNWTNRASLTYTNFDSLF